MPVKFGNVSFHPWIGPYYRRSPFDLKVLVLGESHYRFDQQPEDETETTRRALEVGRETGYFWRTIAGLLAHSKPKGSPNSWDCVAFYNYVQHFVGGRARQRPEDWMWTSKKTVAAFKQVLEELKPDRVLVVGKTNWRLMAGGEEHFPGNPPLMDDRFALPDSFCRDLHFDSERHAYWYPTGKKTYALCAPIFHPAYPRGFHKPGTAAVVNELLQNKWAVQKA